MKTIISFIIFSILSYSTGYAMELNELCDYGTFDDKALEESIDFLKKNKTLIPEIRIQSNAIRPQHIQDLTVHYPFQIKNSQIYQGKKQLTFNKSEKHAFHTFRTEQFFSKVELWPWITDNKTVHFSIEGTDHYFPLESAKRVVATKHAFIVRYPNDIHSIYFIKPFLPAMIELIKIAEGRLYEPEEHCVKTQSTESDLLLKLKDKGGKTRWMHYPVEYLISALRDSLSYESTTYVSDY